MPRCEGKSAIVLIADEAGDAKCFWEKVQRHLDEGRVVALRSPLLRRLIDVLGEEYEGRSWLVLKPRVPRNEGSWLIRFRDVAIGAPSLLIFSPILLLFGVLIKLTSPGPVFFSTTVVGGRKRHFQWYKLRSMKVVPEADEQFQRRAQFEAYVRSESLSCAEGQSRKTKVIDPSRVTRLGRWLRKYSLDEMPQLWNVLQGEMSLVGPRPCLSYEEPFFQGWREHRFAVPAGLTGVWQVFGRGGATFDESAAMDVYYVFRRSFAFDIYLLARTLGKVLRGKGAM